MEWERTSRGGYRRTGVAQTGERRHGDTAEVGASKASPGTVRFKVKFRERLGLPSCPYLIRWRIETPIGSVRLHHWLGPDDERAFHDHPWWFVTVVLRGGYTDHSCVDHWHGDAHIPECDDHLRRFSVRYRPAQYRHWVEPDEGGCWTLLLTGPRSRYWGFWLNGKFRKANKWFLTYGHHPCQ